jgi:hypothetical protein
VALFRPMLPNQLVILPSGQLGAVVSLRAKGSKTKSIEASVITLDPVLENRCRDHAAIEIG